MKNRLAVGSLGLALAGLAACSDAPVSPGPVARVISRVSAIVDPGTAVDGSYILCKTGNTGTFNVTINGAPVGGSPFTLNSDLANTADDCAVVATTTGTTSITVRATETTAPAALPTAVIDSDGDPTGLVIGANFVQFTFTGFHGVVARFVNAPPVEEVCDRYTFGGWVNQKPNHISYGVNAGLNSAGLAWGDFEVNNHANGDKIHVWNVTAYGVPASGPLAGVANARFASGPAEVNGEGGHTAEFRFVDNGEPGTNDQVWLAVDGNQYFALQNVQGGNIQLHDQCKKAPKDEKH